jgi:hypothetical protein
MRDLSSGLKLWKRDTLLGIGIEHIRSRNYFFSKVKMNYLSEKLGFRIIEIPIQLMSRRKVDTNA